MTRTRRWPPPRPSARFEDAVELLAFHLGFTAQRPERDTNNGPDVLWSVGSLAYLVIECKSGATADRIWRSSVEQLAHSMNRFREQYDPTCRATPVMIPRVCTLEGTPPPRPAPASSPPPGLSGCGPPSALLLSLLPTPEPGATRMR
jgi:hypothetical protein